VNVLLVEDDPGAAHALELILTEQPGIRHVEAVPSLQAALDRVRVGGVSVILLDLGLPDSAGLESVKRRQAEAPDVPMVVATGSVEFELSSILAGAQDFIEKGNMTGPHLAQRLRIAFERHRVRWLYQPAKEAAKEIRETLDRLSETLAHSSVPAAPRR
jgi:DNA-binding response OmpR family regulator